MIPVLCSESEQSAGGHHIEHLYQGARAADGDEVHVPGGRLRRLRLRVARRETQLGGQLGEKGHPHYLIKNKNEQQKL